MGHSCRKESIFFLPSSSPLRSVRNVFRAIVDGIRQQLSATCIALIFGGRRSVPPLDGKVFFPRPATPVDIVLARPARLIVCRCVALAPAPAFSLASALWQCAFRHTCICTSMSVPRWRSARQRKRPSTCRAFRPHGLLYATEDSLPFPVLALSAHHAATIRQKAVCAAW